MIIILSCIFSVPETTMAPTDALLNPAAYCGAIALVTLLTLSFMNEERHFITILTLGVYLLVMAVVMAILITSVVTTNTKKRFKRSLETYEDDLNTSKLAKVNNLKVSRHRLIMKLIGALQGMLETDANVTAKDVTEMVVNVSATTVETTRSVFIVPTVPARNVSVVNLSSLEEAERNSRVVEDERKVPWLRVVYLVLFGVVLVNMLMDLIAELKYRYFVEDVLDSVK